MLPTWSCLTHKAPRCRRGRSQGRSVASPIQQFESRQLLSATFDNRPDVANPIATPATINAELETRADIDVYRVELTAGVPFNLSFRAVNSTSLQPEVKLYGTVFGRFTLVRSSYLGSLSYTPIESGTHYFTVTNRGLSFIFDSGTVLSTPATATTGRYSITATSANDPVTIPLDRFEPNNSRLQATNLPSGLDTTLEDLSLHNASDTDFFRFTPQGTGQLTVSATPTGGSGNVELQLYSIFGELLGASTTNGQTATLTYIIRLVPESYVIQVRSVRPYAIDQYTLAIDGPTPAADRLEPNNSFETATNLGVLTTNGLQLNDANIHSVQDEDYFTFTPQTGGRLTVQNGGPHALEFLAILYDSDRNIINSSDDNQHVNSAEVIAGKQYYAKINTPLRIIESYGFRLDLAEGPEVSIDNVSVEEGSSGVRNAVFKVRLSTTPSDTLPLPISVNYTTRGESAIAGVDYTSVSGLLAFRIGEQEKTIVVPITGDRDAESDETFSVVLSAARGANLSPTASQGRGRIINDDGPPLVDLVYTAVDRSLLTANVLSNGHLQVKIGAAIQSDVDPATVRSLTINGSSENDSINLASLSPQLYSRLTSIVVDGGAGNDLIIGSNLADRISGGLGNDTLRGNGGNDTLSGGNGVFNDSINGGDGVDVLVELANTDFTLTNTSLVGQGTDVLAGIEQAQLTGGPGNNRINASRFTLGRATLLGAGGNDLLEGSSGNDVLDGGAGNDTLRGGAGNDFLTGGTGSDALVGLDGNDSLHGGGGNDSLIGGLGQDLLSGGDGNDLLIGGFGTDTLSGDLGNDTAVAGQGRSNSPRNGTSRSDAGDVVSAEVTDELFATLFAFE